MFWTAWASGANAALKVLVLIVLTRLLTPADFGVVSAALIVISISAVFSQLGLAPALVQRPVLEPRHVQTAFVSSMIMGLALAGAVWICARPIADFFHMPASADVLRALALLFPIRATCVVAESLIQRELGFSWLAKRDVVSYGLGYGLVGVVLAWAGFGVWSLVAAQLSQATLQAVLLLWVRPPAWKPPPSWAALRELLSFGAGFTLARLANLLADQGDNVVVGRVMGPAPLGIYTRAFQLMSVPTTLFGEVIDRVLFPTLARVQHQKERLAGAYLQAVASVALIMLPVGVVLGVLAREVVVVLFGPRWMEVVVPFQVFALGLLFRTSFRMSDSLTRATGVVYRRAWRQFVFAALVVLGAWVGSSSGVTGVAFGVLASLTVNFLLMAHLSLGVAGVSWHRFAEAHVHAVLGAALAGILALVSVSVLREAGAPALVRLVGALVVTIGGMGLALWWSPRSLMGPYGLRLVTQLRELAPTYGLPILRARE